MIRLFTICAVVCFVSFPLLAADWPAAELYVGPSYLRIMGSELIGERTGVTVIRSDQDLIGGQVGVAVNPWRHVSLVGTFGYHQGNLQADRPGPVFIPMGIDDVYTYLGGVRLRRKLAGRLTVFAQGQAGGARIGRTNGVAIAAGGGAQLGLSRHLAVEARVEYLPIRAGGNWSDNNAQATVGMVLRFGGR